MMVNYGGSQLSCSDSSNSSLIIFLRGCPCSCFYCVTGETLITLSNRKVIPIKDISIGDSILGIIKAGQYYEYVESIVENKNKLIKKVYEIELENGMKVKCSKDHQWFTDRGWKYTKKSETEQRPYLTINNYMRILSKMNITPLETYDYKKGYLSGVIQGDGHLGVCKLQYLFTLRMKDIEAINRTEKYLDDLKIKSKRFQYNSSTSLMFGIRTTTKEKYFKIKQIIEERDFSNKEFCRGFLAGIFDAEGSCQKNSIRIYNTNSIILKEIKDALTFLGFNYVFEFSHEGTIFPVYSIRLLNSTGGETTEFFQVVDPAIDRKRSIFGKK
jgi:intein/homing endonuclease